MNYYQLAIVNEGGGLLETVREVRAADDATAAFKLGKLNESKRLQNGRKHNPNEGSRAVLRKRDENEWREICKIESLVWI